MLIFVTFAKRQKLNIGNAKAFGENVFFSLKQMHAARSGMLSASRSNFCSMLEENN